MESTIEGMAYDACAEALEACQACGYEIAISKFIKAVAQSMIAQAESWDPEEEEGRNKW